MMKLLPLLTVVLATASLEFGYAPQGNAGAMLLIALVGLLWLVGQWRGWSWPAMVGLILYVGLAAWGVMLGLSGAWLLLAVAGALAAWDLAYFTRRLQQASNTTDQVLLQRIHLRRLALASGLGLLLGAVALRLNLEFGLGWALLLGLLVMLGLGQAAGVIWRRRG